MMGESSAGPQQPPPGARPETQPVVVVAPSPKSPPKYPDLCGQRKLQLEVQILNREIGFLEEELQSLEGLQPVSRFCKDVIDFVGTKEDPLIPTNKKRSKYCCISRWLRAKLCFSLSWICCSDGCLIELEAPSCICQPNCSCFKCQCGCSCCHCSKAPCRCRPSCCRSEDPCSRASCSCLTTPCKRSCCSCLAIPCCRSCNSCFMPACKRSCCSCLGTPCCKSYCSCSTTPCKSLCCCCLAIPCHKSCCSCSGVPCCTSSCSCPHVTCGRPCCNCSEVPCFKSCCNCSGVQCCNRSDTFCCKHHCKCLNTPCCMPVRCNCMSCFRPWCCGWRLSWFSSCSTRTWCCGCRPSCPKPYWPLGKVCCRKCACSCVLPSLSCPESSCGCTWSCPNCTEVCPCLRCSRSCCISACLC